MAYLIWPQVPPLLKKARDWHLLPATEGLAVTHMWQREESVSWGQQVEWWSQGLRGEDGD